MMDYAGDKHDSLIMNQGCVETTSVFSMVGDVPCL